MHNMLLWGDLIRLAVTTFRTLHDFNSLLREIWKKFEGWSLYRGLAPELFKARPWPSGVGG